MYDSIHKFFNFFNFISSDRKLSITTFLVYLLTLKLFLTPDIISLTLFGLVIGNYIHKRYINYKSERIQTNKELIESLREEFNSYKEESKKKTQELEDQLTKSRERLIRIEQDYR